MAETSTETRRTATEVRLATEDHLPELMLLLKRAAEHDHPDEPIEAATAYAGLRAIMEEGIVLAAFRQGLLIGSHGVRPAQRWFSDRWHLWTYWFYVDPDHRRSDAGAALIREMKRLADRVALPLLLVQQSQGDIERTERFLGRHMTKIGGFFLYEPAAAEEADERS